jgi:[protein-PII] uridylyltransferase
MVNSSLVLELREVLREGRAHLLEPQAAQHLGRPWLQEHTQLLDTVLSRIFNAAWDGARATHGEWNHDRTHPEHEAGLALFAIGGYGRGELCPHSDIDIAFVTAEEENPMLDAAVKEAFRLIVEVLIDSERLDVAYAYRPLADCERLAYNDKTALLDARLIAGSQWLQRRLHDELHRTWDAVEYLLEKAKERSEAADISHLSVYAVEPNLKEGAGALRDIQSSLWVAGAMLKTQQPLYDLEWRGIVTGRDCEEVMAANDFFLALRNYLHITTKRKTDVLRAEQQDRCARAFGYSGSGAQASQNLLAAYYRHAEAAHAFSQKVFRRLLEGPLQLDGHFVAVNQRLKSAHPYTLINHPELMIAPFAQARKYGFDLDPELDRAVEEALPSVDEKTRSHPIARAGFWALLCNPESAAESLTQLRERSVLQRFIPEFSQMLRLAPADPSHQLTVGEHSISAVRQLGKMWKNRNNDDEMFAIWNGIDDPGLLVLATLLHDIGKIMPGTDHSVSGAKLAQKVGLRFGLDAERNRRLALLVRRHLLLPRAARLRDLNSPGTIREVIKHVGDVPTLKMLYLLSLADTCAVGDRTYSRLDLEAMRELYERVLIAMTREETAEVLSDVEKREQMAQRERERLRRELRNLELDDNTLARLTDGLPASYVLNTPLPTVATHLKFLEQLPKEDLIVDFYHDRGGNFTEMAIVTYDDPQPGLLSRICGAVNAVGAEILAAHVYTLRHLKSASSTDTRSTSSDAQVVSNVQIVSEAQTAFDNYQPNHDIVLDRLHLVYKGRALPESRCARLAAILREVILGRKDVEDVLKAAGKEAAVILSPERISARNDLSDEHTVITIVNDNVSGLLYYTTRALAVLGLDIHTAKITTWAGRAEDAFYVTRRREDRGEKIPDDELKEVLDKLRLVLSKPHGLQEKAEVAST